MDGHQHIGFLWSHNSTSTQYPTIFDMPGPQLPHSFIRSYPAFLPRGSLSIRIWTGKGKSSRRTQLQGCCRPDVCVQIQYVYKISIWYILRDMICIAYTQVFTCSRVVCRRPPTWYSHPAVPVTRSGSSTTTTTPVYPPTCPQAGGIPYHGVRGPWTLYRYRIIYVNIYQ